MKFNTSYSSETNKIKKRVAIIIQYDGSSFCGWQRQQHNNSVQAELESAIEGLDPLRPIKSYAAGRTDSGVHASGQVVHFDCNGDIPAIKWAAALNGRLPSTIRVRESVARPNNWHACHDAIYRRYRYTIYNGCRPNLFLTPWTWHRYRHHLDEKRIREALIGMIGRYDFSAFMRAGSNRSNAFTTIQEVLVQRNGDLLRVEIQASGFLYGMVRLLMGQLVAVGEHRLSVDGFEKRWRERRRSEVKEAAPGKGLCLIRAGYAEEIFTKASWYDSQPLFFLTERDAPPDPTTNS